MPLVVYFKLQIGDLAAKRVIKEQAASIFSFAKKWAYLKGPPPKKQISKMEIRDFSSASNV